MGLPPRAPAFQKVFDDGASRRAAREQEENLDRAQRFLADYADTLIEVNGEVITVLARRGRGTGDGTSPIGNEPWQCTKLPEQKVRVYPSAIADGAGNHEWPTYEDLPSGPETYFDIQLPPSPLAGWIYLECTVDDSDDNHGLIVTAKLVAGERPTVFLGREGTKVCIPIAEYLLAVDGSFGLDPRRCMVFTLRRFGPPGSFTWDVEPS